MNDLAYKVVCFDDSDIFEFHVLEDVNCGSMQEVHHLVESRSKEYGANAKWLLLPIIKQQIKI